VAGGLVECYTVKDVKRKNHERDQLNGYLVEEATLLE